MINLKKIFTWNNAENFFNYLGEISDINTQKPIQASIKIINASSKLYYNVFKNSNYYYEKFNLTPSSIDIVGFLLLNNQIKHDWEKFITDSRLKCCIKSYSNDSIFTISPINKESYKKNFLFINGNLSKEDFEEQLVSNIIEIYPLLFTEVFVSYNFHKNEEVSTKITKINNFDIELINDDIDIKKHSNIISKYIENNIHRSIIFYGQPGTGKSTLAKQICKNLQKRTLILNYCNFKFYTENSNLLFEHIKFLDIQAVILDDLDRLPKHESYLWLIEELYDRVKLIIATCNNVNIFAPAFIRPKRFDELIEFNHINENIINALLKNCSTKSKEIVKNWPIAFINEFLNRVLVLGEEEAIKSIDDLQKRIKKMTTSTTVDYEEDDLKIL